MMRKITELFKVFTDTSRLRLLFILSKKELCVCQMMGILNMSQPLVSRNLAILMNNDFLQARRDGKLVYYSIRDDLPKSHKTLLNVSNELLSEHNFLKHDLEALADCEEFQKGLKKCSMKAFEEFLRYRKNKNSLA